MQPILRIVLLLFTLLPLACSGGTVSIPDGGTAEAAPVDAPSGPAFIFRVRTSTSPFAHADGLSGQTSRKTKQGIRALRLLRAPGDPSPVLVFDHGSGFVEAGYDGGDDTVVGRAPLSRVPAGTYTRAQVVVTHSRFTVSSTMHPGTGAFPGDFDCVQALSDGAEIDGQVRARGWYRYVFVAGGMSFPQEGTNAPLPAQATTGGFTMKTNGGETYYELEVSLVVPPGLDRDLTVVMSVNMHDAFRWQDQALPGYLPGVYDTTPVSFEPVMRFGANAQAMTLE